jgi:DDE domain
MSNPFRYFNSWPEVIRLVVMMYVRYPLSLRNVEDLLAERGIEISHETVRFWWNRFGPMFAAEIRNRRVAHQRGFPQWRWHLDEVFVKINGKLCYLWRAVDHEGEVLETVVTAKDKAAAVKFLKAHHEEIWPPAECRPRRALLLSRCDDGDRQRRSPRGWSSPQQSGEKLASGFSTTRASHAAVPKRQDATEIQLSSCSGPQPFQPGTSSRRPRNLQTVTFGRARRVARAHGLIATWAWATCIIHRRPAVGLPLV